MDCLHLEGQCKPSKQASCKQNKLDMENLIQIQGSKVAQKGSFQAYMWSRFTSTTHSASSAYSDLENGGHNTFFQIIS